MTSTFEGEVDRIVGRTLSTYGLRFDGTFVGLDADGAGLAICYFRSANCKLQIYTSEREGETGCMIAPADAPNVFGPTDDSGWWKFLTDVNQDADDPFRGVPTEAGSYGVPLTRLRAHLVASYDDACTALVVTHSGEPTAADDVVRVPVTGADAIYRGKRYRVAFSGSDWVALRADPDTELPDAFERGESGRREIHTRQTWAKVPRSAIETIITMTVEGTIAGHTVSLRSQGSDGRVLVEFIGPPAVAEELGLEGDQYMGWTGLFAPGDFDEITVEETS
ncbi:hypothetical protein [Mycolicibacterium sediminis]|uniref:Uncharacterized protein n=1 Tax=Mycolicibacterium sediminis TaxID=1286180 RepID=A0A7I7QJI0_9MYCO|nr:hypothetical protein [Mycolicibacterium sediminis]BBY26402.1 hypothetical protein MSEDJ_04980 [Mycolicibacterium sediminis]